MSLNNVRLFDLHWMDGWVAHNRSMQQQYFMLCWAVFHKHNKKTTKSFHSMDKGGSFSFMSLRCKKKEIERTKLYYCVDHVRLVFSISMTVFCYSFTKLGGPWSSTRFCQSFELCSEHIKWYSAKYRLMFAHDSINLNTFHTKFVLWTNNR